MKTKQGRGRADDAVSRTIDTDIAEVLHVAGAIIADSAGKLVAAELCLWVNIVAKSQRLVATWDFLGELRVEAESVKLPQRGLVRSEELWNTPLRSS